MTGFGYERDLANSPLPTLVPAFDQTIAGGSSGVSVNNGFAVRNSDGLRLGGVSGFHITWCGVLLIDHEGEYAFHAGAPTPDGDKPDIERAEKSQWRVTLKRGQKSWPVLNHQWPGDTEHGRHVHRLRRGAYQIVIELNRPTPSFSGEGQPRPPHAGFQVKYAGPDSDGCLIALPVKHLYRDFQDATLADGIPFNEQSNPTKAFLAGFYTSTLRDVRRTYQRAFKAALFAARFALSGKPAAEDGQSELGYLLATPDRFAGHSYYRDPTNNTVFDQHSAYFDFNFLPLDDNYHAPPASATPDRAHPSPQRIQALFDWWEHVFDYTRVRHEAHHRCAGPLWLLFHEARVKQPADPAVLLRHLGSHHPNLDLRYYQDQYNAVYSVSSTDLEDDRWLVRVWYAERWVSALLHHFMSRDIDKIRPDLWVAQNPSSTVGSEVEPGNANLLKFFIDSCIEHGEPRRYEDVKRLNDGLRQRGRDALVRYLCHASLVPMPGSTGTFAVSPGDLSAALLLDVNAGIGERASRIEEAISAVQTFIRRNRLGLDKTWQVSAAFARLWDSRFETYHTWELSRRREVYRENWIDWAELGKARKLEAFRFLESELRRSTLTLAAPGGLEWWPEDHERLEHQTRTLQRRDPSELQRLPAPAPGTPSITEREGLDMLGTPERRPAVLAGRGAAGHADHPHAGHEPDTQHEAHRRRGASRDQRPCGAAAALDGGGDQAGHTLLAGRGGGHSPGRRALRPAPQRVKLHLLH